MKYWTLKALCCRSSISGHSLDSSRPGSGRKITPKADNESLIDLGKGKIELMSDVEGGRVQNYQNARMGTSRELSLAKNIKMCKKDKKLSYIFVIFCTQNS